jgi:predicted RNase H-like HicB family nuclease
MEIASFGSTIDEALANLKEAVELYLEDEQAINNFHEVSEFMLGEFAIHA